jgi:2-methylisocitrate lyase-like PEP mutase family enzyme
VFAGRPARTESSVDEDRYVLQKITGFHQDEHLDWVADLECGHTQHVRHKPPWTNRPWVATAEGRERFIGHNLDCRNCDNAGPASADAIVIRMSQAEAAELFRKLHQAPPILKIANVWDAASARIVQTAGYPAIGTSSAGIAFSLGYPDGERIPREEMLAQVRRIVRVSSVPVTADLEAAYDDVERLTIELVKAGAVGLNIEDFKDGALVDVSSQVEKIGIVRKTAGELGVPVVINARTDVYLARIGDPDSRFSRTVERLRAYRDAGADCLFVPGVLDEEMIARLVDALRHPLNILGVEGSPPAARLQDLGVARVSLGSGPMRATMGLMHRIAEEFRDRGTYTAMVDGAVSYAEANRLMG